MMTCRDVSTMVAAGRVGRQSLTTRLQIGMHLAICVHCRRFWKQVRAIDRGVVGWLQSVENEAPPDLSERVARRLVADPGASSETRPTSPGAPNA
jgi:anti-sigma factor ChrR (cupin superfamily)